MRLHILQLTVDVRHAAPVREILRNEVPVVSHRFHFSVTRETVEVVHSCLCSTSVFGLTDEAVLEEVVENDDQIAEELVNGLLADHLASSFWRVACITEQKKAVLLVQTSPFAQDALDSLARRHFAVERGTDV